MTGILVQSGVTAKGNPTISTWSIFSIREHNNLRLTIDQELIHAVSPGRKADATSYLRDTQSRIDDLG